MKTITVLEQEDYKKLNQKLSYFTEGSDNFFVKKNNKLPSYTNSFREEHLLMAQDIIDNANSEDFSEMKAHICKRLDSYREDLAKKEKEVLSLINTIAEFKDTLKLVVDSGNFKDAILNLIR